MFKQRSKGKGHPKCTNFADIFLYISKTKGLGENLTTPRDAADIFPSEIINRSDKTLFVFNTEMKEFGKTCGDGSGII